LVDLPAALLNVILNLAVVKLHMFFSFFFFISSHLF